MRDILEIKDNFSLYKGIKSNLLWGNLNYCKSPKVSIIMPVFNHPDYFRKSLSSAINQDYTGDYEIIVIDNNDQTDGPTSNQLIVEEFKSYNPQIQISAESETKRSIFRKRDKTKRSKKESAQHSKSRNKSFVMTSVSAL